MPKRMKNLSLTLVALRQRWCVPFLTLFGVASVLIAAAMALMVMRLELTRHVTEGIVTDKWVEGEEAHSLYPLSYLFWTASGSEYEGVQYLPHATWSTLQPGQPIAVAYAGIDPAESRLRDIRDELGTMYGCIALGAGLLGMAYCFAAQQQRSGAKVRR